MTTVLEKYYRLTRRGFVCFIYLHLGYSSKQFVSKWAAMSLQINTHRVTAKIPNIEYTEATHVYTAYKTGQIQSKEHVQIDAVLAVFVRQHVFQNHTSLKQC